MGAGTYPDPKVEKYIEQYFVPVQFNVVEQPDVMQQFHSTWTPTIIIEDADGKEHRRSQGYLDARRFLGEASLARLKDAIDRGDFQGAMERLNEALEFTRGDSTREPEALYWAAVVAYKTSSDATGLISGWNRLLDQFPDSEWAHRAEFIRQ